MIALAQPILMTRGLNADMGIIRRLSKPARVLPLCLACLEVRGAAHLQHIRPESFCTEIVWKRRFLLSSPITYLGGL
jgi:hypothetical protein